MTLTRIIETYDNVCIEDDNLSVLLKHRVITWYFNLSVALFIVKPTIRTMCTINANRV